MVKQDGLNIHVCLTIGIYQGRLSILSGEVTQPFYVLPFFLNSGQVLQEKQTGPDCLKHGLLNEFVKRSARQVFYYFITKCTDIFCLKNERSFCNAKASRTLSTKNIGIY